MKAGDLRPLFSVMCVSARGQIRDVNVFYIHMSQRERRLMQSLELTYECLYEYRRQRPLE
jgi:hypothetical protein